MIFPWAAAIFDFMKTLPASIRTALHLDAAVDFARGFLPLFNQNLGWLIPAIIGFAIGLAIHFSKRARAH